MAGASVANPWPWGWRSRKVDRVWVLKLPYQPWVLTSERMRELPPNIFKPWPLGVCVKAANPIANGYDWHWRSFKLGSQLFFPGFASLIYQSQLKILPSSHYLRCLSRFTSMPLPMIFISYFLPEMICYWVIASSTQSFHILKDVSYGIRLPGSTSYHLWDLEKWRQWKFPTHCKERNCIPLIWRVNSGQNLVTQIRPLLTPFP